MADSSSSAGNHDDGSQQVGNGNPDAAEASATTSEPLEKPRAEASDTAWSAIAIVAGVFVPGGGHLVLGDWLKGMLFAACLLVLFAHGLNLGTHSNFTPQAEERHYWMYNMQYALGGPALIASMQAPAENAYPPGAFQDPATFEIALLYTAVAGLLNLLILFDLVGLPYRLRLRRYEAATGSAAAGNDSPAEASPASDDTGTSSTSPQEASV